MKRGKLRSVAHNIADSLANGNGFLIGLYFTDIFGEATRAPNGFITVDFLTGTSSGGRPSLDLARAIHLYRAALPALCERHGVEHSEFTALTVRYGTDIKYGVHARIEVSDRHGRHFVDRYLGWPLRRVRDRQ